MNKKVSPWRGLRNSIVLFDWLFNPLQRRGVPAIYTLLGEQSPVVQGLYLNLGYWKTATEFDDACDALARLLADRIGLCSDDRLLDVGFGFGDQDLYWWAHYKPQRIIGLNLTRYQVTIARQRVLKFNLASVIDLRHGSATAMPIAAHSVDKVTALECAFHFRSRERFFVEAFRTLRPGGQLALADIIPTPRARSWQRRILQWLSWHLLASKFSIPQENAYGIDEYEAKLAAIGFSAIHIESIRDDVYEPVHHYLRDHPEVTERFHPFLAAVIRFMLRFEADWVYAGLDYVIVTATKPTTAV
jgi:cyclopropane fatty-acyl-phospholipid synthase-like methyltransferase